MAVGAHTAADVDAEGLDLVDGLADVAGVQAPGQEDWQRGKLDDFAAEAPVVDAAGAAQLLDRQGRISGVEQQGVGVFRGQQRLVDRAFVADMDDLDNFQRRQRGADGGIGAGLGRVDQLQGAGQGAAMVGDDGLG